MQGGKGKSRRDRGGPWGDVKKNKSKTRERNNLGMKIAEATRVRFHLNLDAEFVLANERGSCYTRRCDATSPYSVISTDYFRSCRDMQPPWDTPYFFSRCLRSRWRPRYARFPRIFLRACFVNGPIISRTVGARNEFPNFGRRQQRHIFLPVHIHTHTRAYFCGHETHTRPDVPVAADSSNNCQQILHKKIFPLQIFPFATGKNILAKHDRK